MLVNKTTLHIEGLSVNLITGSHIYVPGEAYIISFHGTFSNNEMVLFLEKMVCVTEKFEWDTTNKSMRRWLRHTANADNPFKSVYTYSSAMWRIKLTVSKLECRLLPQTKQFQPQLSQPTNTKSWLHSILGGLKNWLHNI